MYTVSITSQGQFTIPAPIRVALGLRKKSKANVTMSDDKMIVEPAPDLLSLAGSLNKYAKSGMTPNQIMKAEKKAIEEAMLERFLAKEKRSRGKLLKTKI